MKKFSKLDFLLNRTCFNEDLFKAVMTENVPEIEYIFKKNYMYEVSEGYVEDTAPLSKEEVRILKFLYVKNYLHL